MSGQRRRCSPPASAAGRSFAWKPAKLGADPVLQPESQWSAIKPVVEKLIDSVRIE